MGTYPELERLTLAGLIARFKTCCPEGDDFAPGYYLEIARLLKRRGVKGAEFLKRQLSRSDAKRVRAAIFGLSQPTPDSETVPMLLTFLRDKRPMLVAEAIDGLRASRYGKAMRHVLPLFSHRNPFVIGAALRYVSAFDRKRAQGLLLKSLKDPRFIVRENACDELDALEITAAIPFLKRLLDDPRRDVREAARTAVENLSAAKRVRTRRRP